MKNNIQIWRILVCVKEIWKLRSFPSQVSWKKGFLANWNWSWIFVEKGFCHAPCPFSFISSKNRGLFVLQISGCTKVNWKSTWGMSETGSNIFDLFCILGFASGYYEFNPARCPSSVTILSVRVYKYGFLRIGALLLIFCGKLG